MFAASVCREDIDFQRALGRTLWRRKNAGGRLESKAL